MHSSELTLILLAGNPKCLDLAPNGRTYLDIAFDVPRHLRFAQIVVVTGLAIETPSTFPEGRCVVTPAGATLLESMKSGLRHCQTSHALFLATDLISTPEAVRGFYEQVRSPRAVACGVAPLAECRRLEPSAKPHFVSRFGLIRFASVYLVNKRWFSRTHSLIGPVLSQRKRVKGAIPLVAKYLAMQLAGLLFFRIPELPRLKRVSAVLAVDYDPTDKHMD